MLVAAKTYALISEYARICDMRLITREYGILNDLDTDSLNPPTRLFAGVSPMNAIKAP